MADPTSDKKSSLFNATDLLKSDDPHLRAYEELKSQLLMNSNSKQAIAAPPSLSGIMGGIQSATEDLEKLFQKDYFEKLQIQQSNTNYDHNAQYMYRNPETQSTPKQGKGQMKGNSVMKITNE